MRAFYYTGTIECAGALVTEIKQKLNFADVAIRYLIIKLES
jgi:ribosomal protein S6